jgi:hypothetical protein
MATDPVSYFIQIFLPEDFQLQEEICLDNGKTKERFVTKMEEDDGVVLLISRCPLGSTKEWMGSGGNGRTICLTKELKVVPI